MTDRAPRFADADPYGSYRHMAATAVGPRATAAARLFARAYLVPALHPFRGRPILELGAGDGATAEALGTLGFRSVEASDSSEYQVERARSRGVAVRKEDGAAALARMTPGSLGAVLALDVLEHLDDEALAAWLKRAREALAPDGVFVARVPNGESPFAGSIRYGDLTHRRAFTASSLRQAFGSAGFGRLRFVPCRPIVHGLPSTLRAALWRVVEAAIRIAEFAETGRLRGGCFTRNIMIVAEKGP